MCYLFSVFSSFALTSSFSSPSPLPTHSPFPSALLRSLLLFLSSICRLPSPAFAIRFTSLPQTFLGQKYGFRPIPSKIQSDEFEKILSAIEDEAETGLLQKWFKRDVNAVPANHVLQPISSQIANYLSRDPAERAQAVAEWQEAYGRISETLRGAATKALGGEEQIHKYFMSGNRTTDTMAVGQEDVPQGRESLGGSACSPRNF